MAPSLTSTPEELILSWLEPTSEAAESHRLLMARHRAGEWSEPVELARGDKFFANWADVPKVAVGEDGRVVAHWLEKL